MITRIVITAAITLSTLTALQAQPAANGKTAYESRCVGCHGLDGSGGGHGPSILNTRRSRATTPAALRDVIAKGLPEAGMPAFNLPDSELDAIANYVATLKSPAADHPTDGDPAAGARFFQTTGNCTQCHMVNGHGGILGPDLSNLARDRRLAQIEQALDNPTAAAAHPAYTVRLRNGQTLQGIARYESPFDLGLQDLTGNFHSLAKSNIATLTPQASLMPKLQVSPTDKQNLLAYLTRLRSDQAAPAAPPQLGPGIAFADIAKPKLGEWPTYHGSLSGNRYSPLNQINTTNVTQLAAKWSFPLGNAQRAQQTTPIVAGGIMYATAVNEAWAIDARTGREIWHYSRPRSRGLVGDAAGGINRGAAILGDRIFLQTDNAHLLALHRLTGQLLWDVAIADSDQHYGSTAAPLVVNDLVIAGVSGGDEGIRGLLDAYRASTGERVWRFYTVPAPGEPGSETWTGRAIEHGCAATWLTGSYDPETSTLFWATGNPCPDYNGDERKGDNLYSSSVLALDPATGRLKWHFQFTPHDLHDWDANQSLVLADATFHGQPRKLLLQGNRNGFFYVLDRTTGQFLMAEPFVKRITWASGIGADGRPKLLPDNEPTREGSVSCPEVAGASNWPSTSYNPNTGYFYLMAEESCTLYSKNDTWWIHGQSFYGGGTRRAPNEPSAKFLRALDIQTGKIAFEIPVSGGILESGLMTTAGGLLFYGDNNGGSFIAADARTGKLLWHYDSGLNFKAGPITYTIDGKQYVATTAGASIVAFTLP